MSSGNRFSHLSTPTRRELLVGAAALSATAMLSPMALAQQFPTAAQSTSFVPISEEAIVPETHEAAG